MTYQEAVEEMQRFAGDTTWSLHYVTSSYGGVVIHGYLADKGKHAQEARTYAGAIENVKRMLSIIPAADPPPEDGGGNAMKITTVTMRFGELRSTGFPTFSNKRIECELSATIEPGETATEVKDVLLTHCRNSVHREFGDKVENLNQMDIPF